MMKKFGGQKSLFNSFYFYFEQCSYLFLAILYQYTVKTELVKNNKNYFYILLSYSWNLNSKKNLCCTVHLPPTPPPPPLPNSCKKMLCVPLANSFKNNRANMRYTVRTAVQVSFNRANQSTNAPKSELLFSPDDQPPLAPGPHNPLWQTEPQLLNKEKNTSHSRSFT